MNQGFDPGAGQMVLQLVAARMAHDEQVPGRFDIAGNLRQNQMGHPRQGFQVPFGGMTAPQVPLVQEGQFDPQHRRLQRIQSGIAAFDFIIILDSRTVVAQQPDLGGQPVVIRHHGAPIPEGPEVLAGIKTEAGSIPQPPARCPR